MKAKVSGIKILQIVICLRSSGAGRALCFLIHALPAFLHEGTDVFRISEEEMIGWRKDEAAVRFGIKHLPHRFTDKLLVPALKALVLVKAADEAELVAHSAHRFGKVAVAAHGGGRHRLERVCTVRGYQLQQRHGARDPP